MVKNGQNAIRRLLLPQQYNLFRKSEKCQEKQVRKDTALKQIINVDEKFQKDIREVCCSR